MVRKRDGLVPIGEVIADLPEPVQALREAPRPAQHHFTQADQVNQVGRGQRSGPRPGLHGANDGAVQSAPHQPRQPTSLQARQRPLPPLHAGRAGDQTINWIAWTTLTAAAIRL